MGQKLYYSIPFATTGYKLSNLIKETLSYFVIERPAHTTAPSTGPSHVYVFANSWGQKYRSLEKEIYLFYRTILFFQKSLDAIVH